MKHTLALLPLTPNTLPSGSALLVDCPLYDCTQLIAWSGVNMGASSLTGPEAFMALSEEVNWGLCSRTAVYVLVSWASITWWQDLR